MKTAGDASNSRYPAELSAISELLTALTSAVDITKAQKLGQPLGRMGEPSPELVESPYAELSLSAMSANLDGVEDMWMGTEHDFDQYLASRDDALAQTVVAQLKGAQEAIAAIPAPLVEYVAGDDLKAGNEAYEALDELERTLATDVSAKLAVSLGFDSNDGD